MVNAAKMKDALVSRSQVRTLYNLHQMPRQDNGCIMNYGKILEATMRPAIWELMERFLKQQNNSYPNFKLLSSSRHKGTHTRTQRRRVKKWPKTKQIEKCQKLTQFPSRNFSTENTINKTSPSTNSTSFRIDHLQEKNTSGPSGKDNEAAATKKCTRNQRNKIRRGKERETQLI